MISSKHVAGMGTVSQPQINTISPTPFMTNVDKGRSLTKLAKMPTPIQLQPMRGCSQLSQKSTLANLMLSPKNNL